MKRILFIAMAALPLIAQARDIPAGSFQLSGSTSLDFVSSDVEVEGLAGVGETNSWEARGGAGYYFVPNLALGFSLSHESAEGTFQGVTTDSSTTVVGPQLLLNLSLSEQASLQLGGGFLYAKTQVEDVELDGLGWNVGAGLSFFPHRMISLDAILGYQSVSVEDDVGTNIDMNGIGVGFGLSVYFSK